MVVVVVADLACEQGEGEGRKGEDEKCFLLVIYIKITPGALFTGYCRAVFPGLASVNFKRGSGSRSFCFETLDANRKVTWYAKQVWLVVGCVGVCQSTVARCASCLYQSEQQERPIRRKWQGYWFVTIASLRGNIYTSVSNQLFVIRLTPATYGPCTGAYP